jgi:hypothetical protein
MILNSIHIPGIILHEVITRQGPFQLIDNPYAQTAQGMR